MDSIVKQIKSKGNKVLFNFKIFENFQAFDSNMDNFKNICLSEKGNIVNNDWIKIEIISTLIFLDNKELCSLVLIFYNKSNFPLYILNSNFNGTPS